MNQKQQPNYTFALIIVIAVCFLIGFVTTMNNSMIEFCKNAFNLNDTQGQLVNSAFYGAYALSIPFGLMMSKIGYKKTLVLGLAVVGVGFIVNFLCINGNLDGDVSTIYWLFLGCMFIVALGIVMLQLVANPYVMVLGSPEKGAFRMTLSQAINSVATTVAPIFILNVILSGKEAEDAVPADIPYPYLGLGLFTVLLCVILAFLKLPNINEGEQSAEADGKVKQYKSSVFKYPHVWFGALGIFMYMGLEIGVPSMLPAYFKADPSLGSATGFLSWYWGGMMVGRFIGAAVLSKFQPRHILTACLIGGAACVGVSFALSGMAAVWALLAAGLFHSVMWPLVFNLGLQELGPHTKAASGIINLGVVGAATLTPLMGMVVDNPSLGVGIAICMMFIYYLYVVWFCWVGSKVGLK
ncbi:MAG: glucose/galactose MFS transporter [Prevotellaceae bacterium]|nr:glucose/galactose MFS transporter [Prevotellaceae bacterium]